MASVVRQQPRPLNGRKPLGGSTPPRKQVAPKEVQAKGLFGTLPFTLIHYGPPGCGKTSLWPYLQKVVPGHKVGFLYDSKERGIIHLANAKQCPKPHWLKEVSDFDDLKLQLASVANDEVGIDTLVVDSMTGMELLCFHHHCDKEFGGDWSKEGFYSYQQGPKNAAKTDWPEMLDYMDKCNEANVNVVFIGHSQTKTVNNPEGEDYDQYMPIIDKETWAQTHRWAKAVLFQNYDITLQTKTKGSKKKIAAGGEGRLLYTQNSAAYIAKNLWGLPPVLDLGNDPETSCRVFCDAYKAVLK